MWIRFHYHLWQLLLLCASLLEGGFAQSFANPLMPRVTLGNTDEQTYSIASLTCNVNCSSDNIGWEFDGEQILQNDPLSPFYKRASISNGAIIVDGLLCGTNLLITLTSYLDSGLYTCHAAVGQNESRGSTELDLQVRVASRHSTVETTSAFLEVALSCDMAGYIHPDEDFQWYHNTTRLIGSKYTTAYTNGSNVAQYRGKETIPSRINTLTIRQLNISDAGTYTCRVEGTLAMAEVTLNINEPQIPSDYPHDVLAVAISPTQISITWGEVPPDQRLGSITHYDVLYSQYSFTSIPANVTAISNGSTRALLLSGVQEFTVYMIAVRAHNALGPGPYSPATAVATPTDVPSGYPQNVSTITVSATEILILWSQVPQIDQNGKILGYKIVLQSMDGMDIPIVINVSIVVKSTDFTIIVSDLEEFTDYTIGVSAITQVGKGPFSPPINSKTFESAPSAPPNMVTAVAFNSTSLGLSWSEPNPRDINGLLRYYNITYCTDRDNCLEENVAGNVTRIIFTDLEEHRVYNLSVAAFTIDAGPYQSVIQRTENTLITSSPQLIVLGPRDVVSDITLSCSILKNGSGSYNWQWRANNNLLEPSTNTLLDKQDETKTSLLKLRQLKYRDRGVYTCEVFHMSWQMMLLAHSMMELQLKYAVEAHTTNVTARRGQSSFTLTCSLLGYAPAQKLRWWFQNINKEASTIEEVTSGLHHTVTHTAGDSMIQMGGASPEKSVVSTLTVLDVGASDAGTYLCGTHLDDVTMISVDVIQSQAGENLDIIAIATGVVIGIVLLTAFVIVVVVAAVMRQKRRQTKNKLVRIQSIPDATEEQVQNYLPVINGSRALPFDSDLHDEQAESHVSEDNANSTPVKSSMPEPEGGISFTTFKLEDWNIDEALFPAACNTSDLEATESECFMPEYVHMGSAKL